MRWIAPLLALVALGCTPGKRALKCHERPSADVETPDNLEPFKLLSVDSSESQVANGHILLNQFDKKTESYSAVIDGCGAHVWWRERQTPQTKITRSRMSLDGRSVLYSEYDRARELDTGEIRRVNVKTGAETVTRAKEQHHDFIERPDGKLVWLSWQYTSNLWFDNVDADIASDAIRMGDEGSDGDSEMLFSILDDSGVDIFWACDHMNASTFVPQFAEWSHTNSLIYDPDQDAYFALTRYWDAVLRIEGDGTLSWILGGRNNEFTLIGDTVLPQHGHMSEFWPGGMLVFDNRNHNDGKELPSRVVEYAIDEEARTVEEVWSYDDPNGVFWSYLGDARRLPGGNVLIAWSASGTISEVNRKGEVVWEAQTEHDLGRLEFVRDWEF